MKIAIHQPQFLPWLGFFDKMDQADVFVLLDDVQYKKNEWQNRNKIRIAESWQWVTVPVAHKFGQKIYEIKIDNSTDWGVKHSKALELNYSNADNFSEYYDALNENLTSGWNDLVDLNIFFISYLKQKLGITTDIIRSSTIGTENTGTERLVDICKFLQADVYLSGAGGNNYLDKNKFDHNGIGLEFQEYEHPEYKQVFDGFYPYMSVVDLLLCHGDKSMEIIREGRK